MDFKALSYVLNVLLLVSCSNGNLYLGEDSYYAHYPDVKVYSDESPSIGMRGIYNQDHELYYGVGENHYELMYLTRGEEGKADSIERFLFRQDIGLNLSEIALLPAEAFNPMRDAACFLKVTGTLAEEDQCDGASVCKQYKDLSIYSDTSGSCEFPRMRSFILKLNGNGIIGQITEPGSDKWTDVEKINFDGVTSVPVRISSKEAPFTSVAASATAEGFVLAGKLRSHEMSASFFDLALLPGDLSDATRLDDSTAKVMVTGTSGSSYSERVSTRNTVLVVTPDGFYKLNSDRIWENLPLPAGLTEMPQKTAVTKLESASGVSVAGFRFIVKEAGSEKNLVLIFKESSSELILLDLTTLGLSGGLLDWNLAIVNDEVWLFNPNAATQAKRYLDSEKKWTDVGLVLPTDVPESADSYILSPTGKGFVLSRPYEKELLASQSGSEYKAKKKIYRHHYYDNKGFYSESYVDTFNPPEALRFSGSKLYAERVEGVGLWLGPLTMDYGYIYDFVTKKGRMFRDDFSHGAGSGGEEKLSHFGGIHVSDTRLFFYGGCDKPENRLCISASPVSRLVTFLLEKTVP